MFELSGIFRKTALILTLCLGGAGSGRRLADRYAGRGGLRAPTLPNGSTPLSRQRPARACTRWWSSEAAVSSTSGT